MRKDRREARIRAMQILYAHEISGEPIQKVTDSILEDFRDHPALYKFTEKLVYLVATKRGEFDGYIEPLLANWEMERTALLDKILIRLAMCEILYFEDIPPKVSINEALEIAKLYSTANSSKFINGILDAFLNRMKAAGKIVKSGRGLIDPSSH